MYPKKPHTIEEEVAVEKEEEEVEEVNMDKDIEEHTEKVENEQEQVEEDSEKFESEEEKVEEEKEQVEEEKEQVEEEKEQVEEEKEQVEEEKDQIEEEKDQVEEEKEQFEEEKEQVEEEKEQVEEESEAVLTFDENGELETVTFPRDLNKFNRMMAMYPLVETTDQKLERLRRQIALAEQKREEMVNSAKKRMKTHFESYRFKRIPGSENIVLDTVRSSKEPKAGVSKVEPASDECTNSVNKSLKRKPEEDVNDSWEEED